MLTCLQALLLSMFTQHKHEVETQEMSDCLLVREPNCVKDVLQPLQHCL